LKARPYLTGIRPAEKKRSRLALTLAEREEIFRRIAVGPSCHASARGDGCGQRQRGSNENTNRLLRQYFPRPIDLSGYSQAELNKVARELNERPRKTLNFETPAERFKACVASTG